MSPLIRHTDAVIVGAGLAGLATAPRLAPMPCIVLSPAPLGDGIASGRAQGGIAAAIGPGDTPAQHAADTLAAADGIADPAIASLVAEAAPGCIADLASFGVRFDRDADGTLLLGREGGHHRHRIVHAAGDATGGEIMRALIAAARATPSITVIDDAEAEDLLVEDGEVLGVIARHGGQALVLRAQAVVLATGGIGGLYRETSNPLGARGRGLALAARAGAVLADLEFVQFHPTALDIGRDPMPLITEALRGAGAVLMTEHGERLMAEVHRLGDLAPRDVVARQVWRHRRAGGTVRLDATMALGAAFASRFPTVYASCRAAGIDPAHQPIPVAPAAHYHMGGIATDQHARSSVPGLWAVGECAATGLHGANRLASNSLLEALVFAARAAQDIQTTAPKVPRPAAQPVPPSLPRLAADDRARMASELAGLRGVMSDCVGVERVGGGLRRAIDYATRLRRQTSTAAMADAALVAELIATAALRREESRGGHFRSDHPLPRHAQRGRIALADLATPHDSWRTHDHDQPSCPAP
jgi:L-aspartate oxidase